jgi:predicted membrane chloride channel (bestrophin family)
MTFFKHLFKFYCYRIIFSWVKRHYQPPINGGQLANYLETSDLKYIYEIYCRLDEIFPIMTKCIRRFKTCPQITQFALSLIQRDLSQLLSFLNKSKSVTT